MYFPSSYDEMAFIHAMNANTSGITNWSQIKSYYEKGLESEKNQLSFFIMRRDWNQRRISCRSLL